MELLRVQKLNKVSQLMISRWDKEYKDSENYADILNYVCAGGVASLLKEMTNIRFLHNDEVEYVYTLNGILGNVYAFSCMMMSEDYEVDNGRELYVQSIVVHPKYQGKGYGYKMLSTILSNPEKYLGEAPTNVRALIDKKNEHSFRLFNKLAEPIKTESVLCAKLITMDYDAISDNLSKEHEKE